MLPGVVVEVGGTGQFSAQVGDAVDDVLAGADAVEVTGVTSQPERLPGAGEQPVCGEGNLSRTVLVIKSR
jgi:hypothetical protein